MKTNDPQLISANEIYRIASAEVEESDGNQHGIATRAVAEAGGDKKVTVDLFVKFQYEEMSRKEAWERGLDDMQWQHQMEIERKEIEQAAAQRKLKWQRKLEVAYERKFAPISRWGVGIGFMIGVSVGAIWFFVYVDKPVANFSPPKKNPSYLAAPAKAGDSTKVVEYLKAAQQGDSKAQINLGLAYENGKGIAKDEAQAAEWFRKAAEKGDPLAQDILGYLYANGKGVATDKEHAMVWYRKAAEQGNVNAQFNLAIAYKNGIGLAKDEAEAVRLFGKAAAQGDAEAQTVVGRIYEYGLFGVKKNERQAEAWYQKAADQGNQEAADALIHLEAWLQD